MPYVLREIHIVGHGAGQPRDAVKAVEATLRGDMVMGLYLKSFDPDGHSGRGDVAWTRDVADALKFATAGDALDLWRAQSKVMPLRLDGKPNRPLTAFSITPEYVEDAR